MEQINEDFKKVEAASLKAKQGDAEAFKKGFEDVKKAVKESNAKM